MLADFWIWRHSSGKLISARNEASKNIQKLCTKNKRYHAQNEHTSKIRKWKAAQNDDQNDDRTMTMFLVSESLQTHPRREPKMLSLLVRNYSIHIHCCCCCYFFFCCCSFCCFCFYSFQSLAHLMSTNTKPSGTIGDTQKTRTISATSFRGCNRFSPLLIYSVHCTCSTQNWVAMLANFILHKIYV